MRDWFEYGEVLDDHEHARLLEEQLQAQEAHLSPTMARSMRSMGNALIEWRGQGAYLIDHRGRRYYDCMGAGGTFGLGHSHPVVVQAVREQLDRAALSARVGLVPAQTSLALRLSARAPGNLPFCAFFNSGTEAMEAALKLARLTTGRPAFVGMRMGYHGMSIGTLSVSGIEYWRQGAPLLQDCSLVPFQDVPALDRALTDKVAAVVLEPVQWASGCTVATPDYLRRVRSLCDERGVLMIADEIQCGLGRTGRWFALEPSGVVPDFLAVGKVLSGAVVPISALLYNQRIRQVEDTRPLFNNSTFGGNPLACAAAVATLDVLEKERLVERVERLGEQLERGFDEICRDFPDLAPGHKGIGLMRCSRLVNPAFGVVFQEMAREEHGCLVTSMVHCPEVIRVSPPFVSTDRDLQAMLDSFRSLLGHLKQIGPVGVQTFLQEIIDKINAGAARATH